MRLIQCSLLLVQISRIPFFEETANFTKNALSTEQEKTQRRKQYKKKRNNR